LREAIDQKPGFPEALVKICPEIFVTPHTNHETPTEDSYDDPEEHMS
jgi:hypothetical protein